MRARATLAALAFGLAAASLLGQTPTPVPGPAIGNEFLVNAYTNGDQAEPGIASAADGSFVVVWTNRLYVPPPQPTPTPPATPFVPITGRRFDRTGEAAGPDFQVSTFSTGTRYSPAVASEPDGDFVVVWTSVVGEYDTNIRARLFDAGGSETLPEFTVNTFTTSYQLLADVARNDAGFVVVWASLAFSTPPQDGDQGGVIARRFDASGNALGPEFVVNSTTTGNQTLPRVAMNANGHFVVAWLGQDTDTTGIRARRFDASGNPLGLEFPVNVNYTSTQNVPDVAIGPEGEFVVTWISFDGAQDGIFARRFDAEGNPLVTDFKVNAYTTSFQTRPRVAMGPDGSFVIAWQGFGDAGPSSLGVSVRRFNTNGQSIGVSDFLVNQYTTSVQFFPVVSTDAQGQTVIAWSSYNQAFDTSREDIYARRFGAPGVGPILVSGDPAGVLESGETVTLAPAWVNTGLTPLLLVCTLGDLTGPPGPVYSVDDGTADYGTIAAGGTNDCATATGDCYMVTVSGARPVPHWDATFLESLTSNGPFLGAPAPLTKTWALHIGESFPDVPTDNLFYRFIETLFHNGVTGGCSAGNYCPTNPVTRAQMAVFLLKSKFGQAHAPPACTGTVFPDVPCTGGPFDPWIEELAALGITGGCGGGLYCPGNTVTRQQMAVFLLKALEGSAYLPPACTGVFDDVPCTPGTGFSDWIEELSNRGITGGCSVTPPLYCPTNPNNRGQMAVFLGKTFGLVLY
jgi:hypothetical protein